MIRASVGHENENGGQYQQWDIPVGQDTTAVNVDHLSTLTGDNSVRPSLALASIIIKVNHARAKNITIICGPISLEIFKKQLVAVFRSGRYLPNLAERAHSYLSFIGTAYARETVSTLPSVHENCILLFKLTKQLGQLGHTHLRKFASAMLSACAAVSSTPVLEQQ